MKGNSVVLLIGLVLVAILLGGYLGLFTVVGWENTLENYTNQFEIEAETVGIQTTNAYLALPQNTNNFSFTVKYLLGTDTGNTMGGNGLLTYEIFNYKTNSYETIYDKPWSLPGWDATNKNLKTDGELVYSAGIPEHYSSQTGNCAYNRYYFCLDGMTVSQAKVLSPWAEGSCSYSYICIYPDNYLTKYDYDSSSNTGSVLYFPKLITLNKDYISNGKAIFKITIDSRVPGLNDIAYNNFDIELWRINENNTYTKPLCNTEADINCNSIIERDELGMFIAKWLNGVIPRDTLGKIIQAWSL